jgi:asparagine synthase (glutamine-hydrolysing)
MIWATDDLIFDYAAIPTSLMSEIVSADLKVVFTGEGGDEVFAGYDRYRKHNPQCWIKSLFAPGSGGFRMRGQWCDKWYYKVLQLPLRMLRKEYRRPFIEAWSGCPDNWSNVQKSQYTDLVASLPDNLLVKVDRNSMAFGLEARVPFLDHRVVEFGLALPDELKISSGQGKIFLKHWAERYI